jgi:hypothetical protein
LFALTAYNFSAEMGAFNDSDFNASNFPAKMKVSLLPKVMCKFNILGSERKMRSRSALNLRFRASA